MSSVYSDEFIELNEKLIKKTNKDEIRKLLNDRTNNLEHANFSMDYERLITITAIDHLVCKKILENSSIGINTQIYFEELDKQLLRQPLLLLSLPIRLVDFKILRKYLPNIDRVINICHQKTLQAKEINKKLKNGEEISQRELDTLVKYFDYSSTKDVEPGILNAQDNLARYLLNNVSSLNLHALSFLVKYFGYKKCREEKLDNIQIFLGDISKVGSFTYGVSSSKTITLSKEFFVQTSFLGNKLSNEFSKLSNGKLEGLTCLYVLFHEIRHALQDKEHFNKMMSDISYAMSTRKILFVNDNLEYARNYDFYNIESDANEYGWRWTREVIKEYLNVPERDRLQFYADVYSFKYLVKKVFSAKLDKDKKGRFIGCFEKEQLDAYFKKYPNTLSNQYSHFKVFYDDNGNPKGINELMRVNSSSIFKFKTFYLNQISARIVNGEFLDYNIIDGLSTDEKVNILKNFDNIIYAIERKFYMLSTKKSNGKFLYDDLSQKDKMAIVYNVNKYVQLLQMYCDIVRGFVNRYPDVLDNTDILRKINGSLKTVGKNPLLKFLNCEVHIDLIHLNPIKRGK